MLAVFRKLLLGLALIGATSAVAAAFRREPAVR